MPGIYVYRGGVFFLLILFAVGGCRMFRRNVSEKYEYINNNIKIPESKVKQSFKDAGAKRSKDEIHRKDIIAAKRELQEIEESIDAARDRLNKMVSQDERFQLTTKEIIEASRQLDILIHYYIRKTFEIQKITEINNYASK